MDIFNRFPFSNAHELNLDWILRQLTDLLRRVKHLEESEGGGGGDPGTTNYNDLSNKPKINNVTLQGNKFSVDLGIPTTTTIRAEINHAFQLYDPAEADYAPPYASGTLGYAIENAAIAPEDIQDAVDAYLDDHPALTGMFTNAAKSSLIALLEKVAYIDGNGQQYLNELLTNLAATVTSISAVFTQGAAVIYDTDSLDTLEQYLIVTANYSDGTSSVVTGYTLSGTLTVGTSTITVSYGGQTDTFSVTVTAAPLWTFTDGYTVVKATSGYANGYTYRQATAARACGHDPIPNNNYVFTVTDNTKYQLAAYGVTSLTQHSLPDTPTAVDHYGYPNSSKAPTWTSSDSTTAAFVWLALKKIDGTAFTEAELANGASAVFTWTESP